MEGRRNGVASSPASLYGDSIKESLAAGEQASSLPLQCTRSSPILHELLRKLNAIGRTHDGDDTFVHTRLGRLKGDLTRGLTPANRVQSTVETLTLRALLERYPLYGGN